MKVIKSSVLAVFVLLLCMLCIPAAAQYAPADVEILMDGNAEPSRTPKKAIAVQLDLKFNDLSWYNDALKLSYHIYDKEGNILLFEGERFPIINVVSGEVHSFPVALDLSSFEETKDVLDAVVSFDIVDEKNSFWFSTSPELTFRTASVIYDGHFLSRAVSVLSGMVGHPAILLINLLACTFLVYLLFQYYYIQHMEIIKGPFVQDSLQLDRTLYEKYFTHRRFKKHGVLLCLGKTRKNGQNIFSYATFFANGMNWNVLHEVKEHRRIDLCLIEGEGSKLSQLERLAEKANYPAVICFDYRGTDYDALMEWATRHHYRYDMRSFTFICLKKNRGVEKLLYAGGPNA